jgi:hypothetical protein
MISDLFYIIGLFILIISFSNAINFIKFTRILRWALTFKCPIYGIGPVHL